MSGTKETRRRRRAAAIAVVSAVALLLTGTLAWRSISQKAINNNRGQTDETGARLHDDHKTDQDLEAGANHDVYVENYSGLNENDPESEGNPVYVRVRLYEYMEIGEGAGLFDYVGVTGTPGATDTPDPIDYQDLDEAGTGGVRNPDASNFAVPVIATNPDTGAAVTVTDVTTWPIHIPGSSVTEDDTDMDYYWDWTTGGSKMFMPTFNKDNTNLVTDRTDYGQNEFTAASTQSADAFYADPAFYAQPETHTAKSTLTTADVVTMADWIAMGKPADDGGNGYWVGDEDGWFYWSKALMPSDATGLLLDEIKLVNPPDGEYYYATHIVSQMASKGDWGSETDGTGFYEDGLTDNALSLLNRAAGIQPTVKSITITEGKKIFIKEGATLTLHATVSVENGSGSPGEQYVQWTINDADALFTGGVLSTEVGDAGNIYTVNATSAALPTPKSTSVTVIVYPAEVEEVIGPQEDGNYYADLGDNTYRDVADDGTLDPTQKSAGQDEIIGNADDKYPVLINDDGIKLLGPNEDGSYYAVGGDLKLGTADDIKMWPVTDGDINDLVDYDPDNITYAVNLTQTSGTGDGTNTVKQLNSIKYTAVVKKSNPATMSTVNADNQKVKWELIGTHKTGTTITNSDGTLDTYTSGGVTLTIAIDETVGTNLLTLRATSEEGTAVQTVKVSIAKKLPAAGVANGGKFTDNKGIEWQVLTTDASGNKLVMTTSGYNLTIKYNTTNVWKRYWTANIMTHATMGLSAFYTNSIGSDIKATALPVTITDIRTGVNTPIPRNGGETLVTDLSKAGSGTAAATNAPFILSTSEFNTYKANIAVSSNGIAWWLRTPGIMTGDAQAVYIDDSTGGVQGNGKPAATGGTFRMALWVKT